MGMLIGRHRSREKAPTPAPKRKRRSRKTKAPEPQAPAHESLARDDYAALSDEQVLEAYVTTIPEGEATERDAQVIELRAVSAFA